MMTRPEFILAKQSDSELLLTLMQEFYIVEHLPFNEDIARTGLQKILSNATFGLVYLIHLNQQCIGYIVLTFGFSLEFHGRDAFIDELYIREPFRGNGIGTHAITFAEDICRKEGIEALHLEVDRANVRAQVVYRKAGFKDHNRYLLTKWM